MVGAVFIAAMVAFCPPQAAPAPTAEEWRAKVLAAMFLVDETKKSLCPGTDNPLQGLRV